MDNFVMKGCESCKHVIARKPFCQDCMTDDQDPVYWEIAEDLKWNQCDECNAESGDCMACAFLGRIKEMDIPQDDDYVVVPDVEASEPETLEALEEELQGCTPPPPMTEGENGAAPKIVKDKPQPTLLPMDILLEFVEPAYQEGVIKYVRESWRRGFKILDIMDALERHKIKFMAGEDLDPEAVEVYGVQKTHLAAMVFCCLSALHTLKYHPELDNRFDLSTGSPRN